MCQIYLSLQCPRTSSSLNLIWKKHPISPLPPLSPPPLLSLSTSVRVARSKNLTKLLEFQKILYVLLKFSQHKPKKIPFSSRLKKANWLNYFISIKLFLKRPNGNPGYSISLNSFFDLLLFSSIYLSFTYPISSSFCTLSISLLIIFYLSLSLSLFFSFSLCVLPPFASPIISVLILLSPCLEIRCAGKFSLYTIQMSVLFMSF